MPYRDKEVARQKGKEYRRTHKEEIRIYQRSWYLRNKEKVDASYKAWASANPEKRREYERRYELRLKQEVLAHYGKGIVACVVCGETRLPCLSIDHIEGGGMRHRQEINNRGGKSFYRWLRKNGFPEGYQTLCMNCQFIKKFENTNE